MDTGVTTSWLGLSNCKKDESILGAFKQAVHKDDKLRDYELRDADVEKVHRALATFSFHAYTGFRWLEKFISIKQSSKDTSNMTMCNVIQTTGPANRSSYETPKTATKGTTKPKEKTQNLHSILVNGPSNPGIDAVAPLPVLL